MVRWLALVALLGGCDKLFGLQTIQEDPLVYERTVTISPPAITSTLVDFPVSIVITNDEDVAAHASADDIRFTDAAGAPLPYEIVDYADGSLEAWVRVTLQPEPTEIRLLYGGTIRTTDAHDTWAPVYEGVWHLSDSAGVENDSTRNAITMVAESGTKTPASVPGTVGKGRQYVDAVEVQQRSMLCASAGRAIDLSSKSFSYSAWINAAPFVNSYSQPFSAGGYVEGVGGLAFEFNVNTLTALVADVGMGDLSTPYNMSPMGRWVFLAAVVDRGANKMFVFLDGALANTRQTLTDAQGTALGNVTTEKPICLGGYPNGYSGLLDEVRIYNDAISADWIRSEYANITDPTTFVTIDPRVE